MTPLNTLAERKGLLAIASLASAILLIGALVPGYYVWTINYAINPLTDSETIDLPKTTGATIDQYIKIHIPLYKAVYEPGAVAEVVEGEEGEELIQYPDCFLCGESGKYLRLKSQYVCVKCIDELNKKIEEAKHASDTES